MNVHDHHIEIDPKHFRRVMGHFASGVTIITADAGGDIRGMTANAFMSGSLDPPLCIVSITKRAHMHGHIQVAKRFAVNILASGQETFASHFAGRPVPGLDVVFRPVGGVPVLEWSAAFMTAELWANYDCGDHTIFVGHIRQMEASDRAPLLYHEGRYAALVPLGERTPTLPEFW